MNAITKRDQEIEQLRVTMAQQAADLRTLAAAVRPDMAAFKARGWIPPLFDDPTRDAAIAAALGRVLQSNR